MFTLCDVCFLIQYFISDMNTKFLIKNGDSEVKRTTLMPAHLYENLPHLHNDLSMFKTYQEYRNQE